MTQIKFADFEGGSDGAAVATGFESYNGTVNYETTGALRGTLSAQVPSGTTAISNLQWSSMTAMSDGWCAGYFQPPAAPNASPWTFALMNARASGVTVWSVNVDVSGNINIKDGSTVRGTSTFACDGSTPVRIAVNATVSGNLTMKLYYGANLNSSTPSETLSGAYSGAAWDRVNIGLVTTQTSGLGAALMMDDLSVDDADEPLLPAGTNGAATYGLTITHTTDTSGIGNRTYEVDATGSTGTVTLSQNSNGAPTVTPTESPTGVFTWADPGTSLSVPFSYDLTAAGTGGGTDDTVTIDIPRGGATQPAVLTFTGGTVTDISNWG